MPGIKDEQEKAEKEFQERSTWGRFMIMGTNFAGGSLALGFVGHFFDTKFHHEFRYMVTGVVLGIVWGTYEAIKQVWLLNLQEKRKAQSEKKPDA